MDRGLQSWMTVLALATMATAAARAEPAQLRGTLWWVSPHETEWSAEEWGREFEAMQALGIDTMVLNGPFVGAELPEGEEDPLVSFFEEGDRRGMHFYLDTLQAPSWWTLKDATEEVARACTRARLLEDRYGRFKSFEGFYVPYELYVMWDDQADLVRTLYREVAKCCKAVAPHRPVLISPFFILDQEGYLGNYRWASPEEYEEFWTETLRQAPIDIVALQDSGEHLSFYTAEDRRPFFQAMKAACDAAGKTLWANVETGELHVDGYEDYVERFGIKTHVNDAKTQPYWRGVPVDHLKMKLDVAGEFSPRAITWGYREFIRPSLGPEAAELHRQYRDLLNPKR